MPSDDAPILAGIAGFAFAALASLSSREAGWGEPGTTEERLDTDRAWEDFFRTRPGEWKYDPESVYIDQRLERGEIPPGFFHDTRGHLVSPKRVIQRLDIKEPRTLQEATELATRHYTRTIWGARRAFYARQLSFMSNDGYWTQVSFNPPVRVQLLPTPHDDLVNVPEDPEDGLMIDQLLSMWRVRMLEERPDVLASRHDLNFDYNPMFEALWVELGED